VIFAVGRTGETAEVRDTGFVVSVEFVLDGGEGAEELLNDVGEDGSFFGGDTVLREEEKDFAQDAFHVLSGVDLGAIAEEGGCEIGGCGILEVQAGMRRAERGGLVLDVEAAAAACPGAMLTPGESQDRSGVIEIEFHFGPLGMRFESVSPPPPKEQKSAQVQENKREG